MKHRIYVASSWRNDLQPTVVAALRAVGHEVYDFRNPAEGDAGFSWREISPDFERWTPADLRQALTHPAAERGFGFDMTALARAELVVMVQPCGRSAALEFGWAVGAGKRTAVLLGQQEPELMLKMADRLCLTLEELVEWSLVDWPKALVIHLPHPGGPKKDCPACLEEARRLEVARTIARAVDREIGIDRPLPIEGC